jgi:cytohesin
MRACDFGCLPLVKLLLAKGANVNTRDEYLSTPMHHNISGGAGEAGDLMLGREEKLRKKTGATGPITTEWLFARRTEIAKVLVKAGARVDSASKWGNTPLHRASLYNQIEIVKLLIEHGADVNAKADEDYTPVDFARSRNHTEVIKILRAHGAKD